MEQKPASNTSNHRKGQIYLADIDFINSGSRTDSVSEHRHTFKEMQVVTPMYLHQCSSKDGEKEPRPHVFENAINNIKK